MENPNYKNENIEIKPLKIMQQNQFVMVKKWSFRIKKRFYRIERQISKNKKRDRRTIFKPIIATVDDMDRFEKKEMKKIRTIKNTWKNLLINYIPQPKEILACWCWSHPQPPQQPPQPPPIKPPILPSTVTSTV